MADKGYIYILTNPSFPNYVKIGYADNVEERVSQLNRTECTPFAFRVYATYEVSDRLKDIPVHQIIDKLNPDLRSIDEVEGKTRVREFFAMSPEDAYNLLLMIAKINGFENKLKLWKKTKAAVEDEKAAEEIDNLLSDSEHNRLEFWTMFNDVLEERGLPFNKRKPSKDHWYNFAIGTTICDLCMDLVNKEHFIRIKLNIFDNKTQYDYFYEHRSEIEESIGAQLIWDRIDGKKASWISYKIDGLDYKNKSNYRTIMNESIDMLIKMRDAFKPYVLK